jgi:hypothetical protein
MYLSPSSTVHLQKLIVADLIRTFPASNNTGSPWEFHSLNYTYTRSKLVPLFCLNLGLSGSFKFLIKTYKHISHFPFLLHVLLFPSSATSAIQDHRVEYKSVKGLLKYAIKYGELPVRPLCIWCKVWLTRILMTWWILCLVGLLFSVTSIHSPESSISKLFLQFQCVFYTNLQLFWRDNVFGVDEIG